MDGVASGSVCRDPFDPTWTGLAFQFQGQPAVRGRRLWVALPRVTKLAGGREADSTRRSAVTE